MISPKILDYIHENYHLKKIENYIRKHFNSGIDVIFDVGCYKGSFIEICLNIYKSNFKIYAFEAENKIYERLKRYKSYKNINIYNFGISDKDGLLDFNVSYQEKPLMIWIWFSTILIAIGGSVSFLKRYDS